MNECVVIADILDNTRRLGKYFIKQLDEQQLSKRFEIEGYKLNSATWLIGHIIWAENWLTLEALEQKGMNYPWIQDFGFGSDGDLPNGAPRFEELIIALDSTHAQSQEYLRSLNPKILDEAPLEDLASYWDTKRKVLYHAIRHEAQHIGHISWLVNLHNTKLNK